MSENERHFAPALHTTHFPPPEPGEVPHPICSECSHVNAHDARCSRTRTDPERRIDGAREEAERREPLQWRESVEHRDDAHRVTFEGEGA